MKMQNAQHYFIALAMLLAAGLAFALVPSKKLAEERARIDLNQLVPASFGEWKVDTTLVPIQVSPDLQAKLDKIYTQTLARTYVNSQGKRVMLSVAYGGDQRDTMQVHLPDYCYPAQGFVLSERESKTINLGSATLSVTRMLARQRARIEPITYWLVIGNESAGGEFDRKLARFKYGLLGTVPDGMLVRVSSIGPNKTDEYVVQEDFIRAIFSHLDKTAKIRLTGVKD